MSLEVYKFKRNALQKNSFQTTENRQPTTDH